MRAIALLFLAGDEEIAGWLRPGDRRALADLGAAVSPQHVILAAAAARRQAGQRLLQGITCRQAGVSSSWQHWLDSLTINPLTGIPILALVIYFLLYRFVGLFGAGVLVDFLDGQIFGKLFTPLLIT